MNANREDMAPISSRQLDRLVDGEMSEAERHALLGRLDVEPEGWRRCALAFLESQCWKQALGPLGRSEGRTEIEAAESGTSTAAGTAAWAGVWRRSSRLHSAAKILAMAASFVVALGLGWWARPLWHGEGSATPQVAQNGFAPAADATRRDQFPAATMLGGGVNGGSPWQMVTLSAADDEPGQRQTIQVPAIERNGIDGTWLNGLPSVPPDVLQVLRRTGHQVQQPRQLLPVPLNDGRRLVIPMDQIEVRRVGDGYQ